MKFPSVIYVVVDGEKGEEYLLATKTILGIEDGSKVAIYRLQEIRTQQVTEKLV